MQNIANLFTAIASQIYIYISGCFSISSSTTENIAPITTSCYTYDAVGVIPARTDTQTETINTKPVEFQGKAKTTLSLYKSFTPEQNPSITAHITITINPGILHYGYRYYSPGMGRWVSRDLNLYSAGFERAEKPAASFLLR